MDKKVVAIILVVLFFCTGGCAVSGGGKSSSSTPVSAKSADEIPSDTQIIEGMKTSKTPAGKPVGEQNEDILELKHWKYGSDRTEQLSEPQLPHEPEQPQVPVLEEATSDDWEPVSIQLLSQEDIEFIVKQLIKLGYLKGPAQNEADFQSAIRDFQRDHSLPITGKLDAQTRELINKK